MLYIKDWVHSLMQEEKKKMFTCEHCKKGFVHQSSQSRHKKNCKKASPLQPSIPPALLSQLQDFLQTQKEAQPPPIIINNINIQINSFGKEDTTHVGSLNLDKLLYRTKLGLVQLLEHIHFHHKEGKNNNVRVCDLREDIMEYFDGQKWKYGWKNDILQQIVENGLMVFIDYFEDKQDKLQQTWSRTMYTHVEKWLEDMIHRIDSVYGQAKADVCLMISNNTRPPPQTPCKPSIGHRRTRSIP